MTRIEFFKRVHILAAEVWASAKPMLHNQKVRCPPIMETKGTSAGRVGIRGCKVGRATFTPDTVEIRHIKINYLILKDQPESELLDTLRHEFAHVVAVLNYGKLGHGRVWKHYAHQLGGTAAVYHEYDLTHLRSVKTARKPMERINHGCGCPGRTHQLTPIRANRIARRQRDYQCLTCRGKLYPFPDVGQAA